MVKIKYDVQDVEDFAPYEGPMPPRGIYEAVTHDPEFGESKGGFDMFTIPMTLKSNDKDKKKYNGCPLWQYVTIGDLSEDWQQRNLKQLVKALGLAQKGNLDTAAVLRKLKGAKVRVLVQVTNSEEFGEQHKANGILPLTKGAGAADEDEGEEEVEDEEGTEDEEEGDEEEYDEDARREELGELTKAQLLKVAKELELTIKRGTSEDDIIDLIVGAETEEPEEDEEEAEEEEGEEEGSVEDEIAELTRAQLRKYIKDNDLDVRVTTKMTDDGIREAILAAWPEEDEEEEPEEGEAPF